MGGNVRLDGIVPSSIDIRIIERDWLVQSLESSLIRFMLDVISTDKIFFSGSSVHLFSSNIDSEELKLVKPVFNDIDIQVNKEDCEVFRNKIPSLVGSQFDDLQLQAFKHSSNQTITVFKHIQLDISIQIDFEFVEFQNRVPSEWAKFSHSSPWIDLEFGVKGVFHKLLLRALTAPSVTTINLKTSKGFNRTSVNMFAFSIQHGLRIKYRSLDPYLLEWEEIPTSESSYMRDPKDLSCFLLCDVDHRNKLNSFVDLCSIINSEFTPERRLKVYYGFSDLLWGLFAQRLYIDDPEKDRVEKEKAFSILTSGYEPVYNSDTKKYYYENY